MPEEYTFFTPPPHSSLPPLIYIYTYNLPSLSPPIKRALITETMKKEEGYQAYSKIIRRPTSTPPNSIRETNTGLVASSLRSKRIIGSLGGKNHWENYSWKYIYVHAHEIYGGKSGIGDLSEPLYYIS